MSVYEEFTSILELESWDSQSGLMIQSDDHDQNVYSLTGIKPHYEGEEASIFDVLDSPVGHDDAFSEDWLEETNLHQMLEELTGMAVENPLPPSIPQDVKDSDQAITMEDLDENIFSDLGLSGFELLQQLVVNVDELNNEIPLFPESSCEELPVLESELHEILPGTSDDSGISSMDSSFTDERITTVDLTDLDASSIGSPLSAGENDSELSSAPVSPSMSESSQSDVNNVTTSELYKLMTQGSTKVPLISKLPVASVHSKSRKSKVKTVSTDTLEVEFLTKKEKKKLQNKNAAIRYRQKKKVETDDIKLEEDGLESKNKDLSGKVEELQREILYMKTLMNEVYKARGGSQSPLKS